MDNTIFVYGSNRQGRNGAGAALYAVRKYGAINGIPEGRSGNAYAIITKELRPDHPPVTLTEVERGVSRFIDYAAAHPELSFIVSKIGCGLAGFREEDIKPMFAKAPNNCILPASRNTQIKEGWEIDDTDDHYSIEEFYVAVENGHFIDYDGVGYFTRDGFRTNIQAIPSLLLFDTVDQLKSVFDGVIWYNK